ncbi:DUF5696 domain-containing protein [Gracilibacillus thailandensis]|uniref:Solute-binding protein family 5 domain-containing protein n=1 Tax=Gracilibacillus thailandensis TaxID=563735 RepID=A0A6N7QXB1_9BACI|nr:DUF5696 domain-containing protein [Gracilibacillus thailandensis]MRI66648.1 hypothetical protein [Gracilibacillus thailandensis]
MSKVIMRSLLTLFLVMILISGCSNTNTADVEEVDLSDMEVTQDQPIKAVFDDRRLKRMIGIAENDYLQLFVDKETASIAVINKQNDEIWYSNPPDRDKDPIASGINSDILSSQMQLSFYNNFGQSSNMNSYSDSVVYEQFSIEPIEDGVKVRYQFGTNERTAADLPLMLSAERFEELSGQLDGTGQRALMIAYRENSETGIYERNDGALTGLQLERAFQAFEDAGYTEEDLEEDMNELNFTQESENNRVFIAAVEYKLEDDSLLVKVPTEEIYYTPDSPIHSISFLRYFGAAGTEETGSIFVPDGSGSLIHFNNGKTNVPSYQQSVYGQDLALLESNDARTNEVIRLPVFGLIKEESAMLAIIEEGAASATIRADVSGRLNSYNFVYPSFTVINKDDVSLQAEDQERSLPRFQEEKMKSDFSVRYAFLSDKDASYSGMARYYQNYLVENDLIRSNQQSDQLDDIPFYVQLVGSVNKQQHFAGVPYQALQPLTTFEQAEHILEELKARDVNNLKLNYIGWFNKGMNHSVPSKVRVDRAIGGDKGFKNFIDYAQEQGIRVFPETALLQVHSDSGFKSRKEASRTLTNLPATTYPINRALNKRDRSKDPQYSLSPRYAEEYTSQFVEELIPFDTTGVALRDLADVLNSDFRRNEQIDRLESEEISVHALEMLYEKDLEMMAHGGNLYSLPYLTDVINVPLGHTGFKIQDEAIPFYQMVLRGYVDYATTPFNLSTYLNDQDYILNVLEYGSNINFQWIYESNDELKNTSFDHLYAVNYERWVDQATEIYHEVNEVLRQTKGETIRTHESLEENVYKTTYNNDFYIIVNYGLEPVTIDGYTVEPQSYVTGGGDG